MSKQNFDSDIFRCSRRFSNALGKNGKQNTVYASRYVIMHSIANWYMLKVYLWCSYTTCDNKMRVRNRWQSRSQMILFYQQMADSLNKSKLKLLMEKRMCKAKIGISRQAGSFGKILVLEYRMISSDNNCLSRAVNDCFYYSIFVTIGSIFTDTKWPLRVQAEPLERENGIQLNAFEKLCVAFFLQLLAEVRKKFPKFDGVLTL